MRAQWLRSFARWSVGVVGASLVLATQISPEQATSNLAAWAQWFGLGRIPDWLATTRIDTYAAIVGALMAASAAVLGARRLVRSKRAEVKAPALAIPDWLQIGRELEERVRRGHAILMTPRPIRVTQVEHWLSETRPIVAKCGEQERSLFDSVLPNLPNTLNEDCGPYLDRYIGKLRLIMGRAYARAEGRNQAAAG